MICYIITYHIVHFVEGFVEINIQAARRALGHSYEEEVSVRPLWPLFRMLLA